MLAEPKYWLDYYRGGLGEQRILRHYSYSDRNRYNWPTEDAKAAVSRLLGKFGAKPIAAPLISQFLPRCYQAVRREIIAPLPQQLILESIRQALRPYLVATGARQSQSNDQGGAP